MTANKKGAPLESAGSLGTPSNFEQNNTLFVRKIQAWALLFACLVGSVAYCAGMVLGGLFL